MTKTIALIVAAGRGHRAGGEMPKQYRPIAGQGSLRRAAAAFAAHPGVDAVRVVIHPDDRARYAEAVRGLDLMPPVAGGETRQQSVLNGLESLAGNCARVLIHDAARPFVSAEVIDAVLAALDPAPAALPCLPVVDSLKRGRESVEQSVDRAGLWRAQTPQGFAFDAILAAHRAAAGTDHTDDAGIAEAAGLAVAIVPGSEDLFKVTEAADFARAERHVMAALADVRTGMGFDVHAFGAGDHVWLGGLRIPHMAGLLGHSDADVALHALTDAILGAVGAGDIGQHFPPGDPQWKGASSDRFLAHAAGLVRAQGGAIAHCDLTIICEAPKIGPHRAAMAARIAEILAIDPGRVSVKATTTEKLGFTGRREGIAAQAAATVRLPL